METADLERYIEAARGLGATDGKVVSPASVVTAPWVRWKCQFGCDGFGRGYCCPPHTPGDVETRRLLDSYRRALLLHREAPSAPDRSKASGAYLDSLVDLEGMLFKDGYYKALVLVAGPCRWCADCAKVKDEPCRFGAKARPSMESCGIDVFRTARDNGFFIETLRERTQTRNLFCLLLVD